MAMRQLRRAPLLALMAIAATAATHMHAALGDVTISDAWLMQDVANTRETGESISKVGFAPAVYAIKPYVKPDGRATGPTSPDWYRATVPGTILTTLVKNNVYPDPMYGENNRPNIIPESLCRTAYWYRTEATVPADNAGKRTWLNFEGINYTADVWVNGKNIGAIKGAFARGIFDITDLVKPGEKAAIAVRINPPVHPGNPQEQTVANGTGPNGGDLMADGPTFGCAVGWDWIPAIRDRDMGIWQKVTLSSTGPVRVDDPSVSSDLPLPRTDSADLTLITTVRNATDAEQSGTLRGTYDGGTFAVPVTLKAHEMKEVTVTPKEAAQLHMINPKLWWPNTYGAPNLYKMHVSFDVAGRESDARDTNFGVRKITYKVTPDVPIPATDNLTVIVNGVPIMCKGGCWGMDNAMKQIPPEVLDAKVRFHQLANYTMIRNWVGQSTSEDFYEACDKYGILVWDEMFQANRSDGPDVGDPPRAARGGRGGAPAAPPPAVDPNFRADTIAMYLTNVREKIARYRSHPSIALWCGRNESDPGPAEVANGLLEMTRELDPARFYQPNSGNGRGVQSGGPYSWRVPTAYYSGGFGRGGAGGQPGIEAFKTELGSVSIPTLESIKAWMPEKDLSDLNDDWAEHDLCSGAQNGNTFPASMAARFGPIAKGDYVDFVRKSQMAMYETYRAMYEGRMARLFDPCSAVLTWMSNPSQPSFVWQIYSYDLEPLAALYGAKKGSEPLHIMMNQSNFHLQVINTSPEEKEGLKARVRVFNMDGTQKSEASLDVTAKPCAATDLDAIEFPGDLSPVHFVKVELADAQGKLISDNFYWRTTATTALPAGGRGGFGAPATTEDLSPLETMPTAEVQVTLNRHDADGKCLIDATITNRTKTPALNAHLQLRKAATKDRVLPVFYSDNYVSLLPGESKTISIEASSKDLGDNQPLVTLDGWNVSVADRSFPAGGGASVTLNKDAFVEPKAGLPAAVPVRGGT